MHITNPHSPELEYTQAPAPTMVDIHEARWQPGKLKGWMRVGLFLGAVAALTGCAQQALHSPTIVPSIPHTPQPTPTLFPAPDASFSPQMLHLCTASSTAPLCIDVPASYGEQSITAKDIQARDGTGSAFAKINTDKG